MPENPTAADIMAEVRQGLADTTLSDATRAQAERLGGQQTSLRQAHEYAPVLGRCGGSFSGRVCRWLRPLAKPVIEQIDLFHQTVIRMLQQLVADSATNAETRTRLQDLEQRLQQIEEQSKRDT